jgi:glycosyltransferase involved in cell wall biosynthesis
MIQYFRNNIPNHQSKFSIIIPSWNNLEYLELCINSIRKNSYYPHQIIIHVNEGSDGTLQWIEKQNLDYTYSKENIGICWAMNAAYSLATTDYIVYFNDDMYACPKWDYYIQQEILKIGHNNFYLSATMIEPRGDNSNKCVIAPFNFGDTVNNFREDEFLKTFSTFEKKDWCGASWPPSIMHRQLWDIIGGFSIEYSPGMYSDPDISMKMWKAGVRIFKGIGESRVYHFMTKSTHRLTVKNNGRMIFKKKWGISAGEFSNKYLLRGLNYTVPQEGPNDLKTSNFIKRIFNI